MVGQDEAGQNEVDRRQAKGAPEAWLFYDGDCPFCTSYVHYVRLKDAVGKVNIVSLRSDDPAIKARVEDLVARGFDIDQGMVLKLGESYYHGDACIHMLAVLSSRSTLFNRVTALVFRSPQRARLLYPVLRTGRNLTLALLGRRRLTS